jgi:hypothetical protein
MMAPSMLGENCNSYEVKYEVLHLQGPRVIQGATRKHHAE